MRFPWQPSSSQIGASPINCGGSTVCWECDDSAAPVGPADHQTLPKWALQMKSRQEWKEPCDLPEVTDAHCQFHCSASNHDMKSPVMLGIMTDTTDIVERLAATVTIVSNEDYDQVRKEEEI